IAGSSDVYLGGFITYSSAAKRSLIGVAARSLEAYGAVSEQVAAEMALGARTATGADLAVSITGIAGPGGSEHKPEGRVCFGLASATGSKTETIEFGALGRSQVRQAATDHALALLLAAAKGPSRIA
ncbi:MAG TPA: nicotinamide-nucleotide amidohydrolase family protein, partial [Aliiroseovarius sp.]|nr:nicotinamide-nucleotide amidohydrolase family protein [Aliiroseovarius sp.]